ncbi:uncharacterized protein RCH25_009285 [Pelodytes ibericus]
MHAIGSSSSSVVCPAPPLGKDDKYHIFISCSSGDSIWVYGLIHKLEDTFPTLKICYHERDFVPGKTIIDNMVDCIHSSQKTLVVLSPDFVRSRCCLFEANLSMLRNCMVHKTIIPIMLKPCPVPSHLSHLTYLEAEDDQFFEKLSQALFAANDQMAHSTLVHYQPSVLYKGKTIHSLPAINEGSESWQPGIYASASVPDPLKALVDEPGLYMKAIEIINDIHPSNSCLRFTTCKVLLCIVLVLLIFGILLLFLTSVFSLPETQKGYVILQFLPLAMIALILMPTLFITVLCWKSKITKKIYQEMVLKTGQANLLLMQTGVLVGCPSRSQLFFVYIPLHECKKTFNITFEPDCTLSRAMWEKAIVHYSSDYACCLARKHFPFNAINPPRHLEESICFCQFVAAQQN